MTLDELLAEVKYLHEQLATEIAVGARLVDENECLETRIPELEVENAALRAQLAQAFPVG